MRIPLYISKFSEALLEREKKEGKGSSELIRLIWATLRSTAEYTGSIDRSRITREKQEAIRFRKQVFALRPLLRFFRLFGLIALCRVVYRKRHSRNLPDGKRGWGMRAHQSSAGKSRRASKGGTKSDAMAFGIKWKGVPFDTVNPLIQLRYHKCLLHLATLVN